jgi:flagellar hook protein FlgE
MLGPTFSALVGLNNASKRLQNSANNLAIVQTAGLKKGSNVDIAEEMVDQIIAKAAFKANVNVIKANDEMIGSLLDIKS